MGRLLLALRTLSGAVFGAVFRAVFWTALCTALWAPAPSRAAETVRLGDGTGPASLAGAIEHLLDPTRAMTLPEARAAAQAGRFSQTGTGAPNFGPIKERIWLRIPVESVSDAPRSWYIDFNMNFMQGLDTWVLRDGGARAEQVLAQDLSSGFATRPVAADYAAARFTMDPGEKAEIWIAYWSGGGTSLPLEFLSENAYLRDLAATAARNYAYYGMMGMLALTGLAALALMRQWVFLSFSAYTGLMALYLAHMDGATFHHLWPGWPEFNAYASLPLGSFATLASALYVRGFLRTRGREPLLDLFLILYGLVNPMMVALSLVMDTQALKMASTAVASFAPLIYLIAGVWVGRGRWREVRFFLVGWSAVLVSGGAMALSVPMGLALSRDMVFDLIRAVTVFESLMMATAIVDRYQQLRRSALRDLRLRNRAMAESLGLQARLTQIEERHRGALEAARRGDRRMREAAHDLRQPIHALRMTLQAQMRDDAAPDAARREMIERSFTYLEGMLTDQLEGRGADPAVAPSPPRGADPIAAVVSAKAPAVVAASRVLDPVADMFREAAAEKGMELRCVASSAAIRSDPLKTMRVLSNLASNAVKYGRRPGGGGRVLIGVRRRGGAVDFEVHDEGPGMSAAEWEAALASGARVARTAGAAEGHGLGLSICAELAAAEGLRLERIEKPRGAGVRLAGA